LAACAHREHTCVIVVSHDLRVKEHADRAYYLEDGSLREITEHKFVIGPNALTRPRLSVDRSIRIHRRPA
jgi:ABC-type lipoprotein export system ATPase subunit